MTWEPGDLNVLIGPNASGKSNFLRGMELLQTAGTGDLDTAILRQGGISSLLWNNQSLGQFGWHLEVNVDPEAWFPVLDLEQPMDYLIYELLLGAFSQRYTIESEDLRGYSQEGNSQFTYLDRNRSLATIFDSEGRVVEASSDRLEQTQTVLAQANMLRGHAMFLLNRHLKGWRIYQDLNVCQDSPVRRAAITRREIQLAANGQNLVSVLHTLYTSDKQFKVDVNDAMRAAFGREFEELEFTPAEDQRVQMRLRWKSLKGLQAAADLSDGTLRFLMLLAILANRSRGDLVAIDEPETGLHPSMFPIIAELAEEASGSSQVIFTTHSPEFLTAVGPHNPKTTVVQNVEGETKLNILDGDDLKRWLEKYTLGELFVSGGAEALT